MKLLFNLFKIIFIFPNLKFSYFKNVKDKDFLLIESENLKNIQKQIKNDVDIIFPKIQELKQQKLKDLQYNFKITHLLSNETTKNILNYFTDENFLTTISEHFGYKVKFSNFIVRYNYFNPKSPEEFGPKMWHRDNDSLFGQLKLFVVINQLNDESGGHFYFIPQKFIPSHKKIYSNYSNEENFSLDDSVSRIKNLDVNKKYNLDDKITKYGNNKSYALVLDTNETYHKGGFIKKEDSYRILMQAVFEPKYMSLSNYSKFYNNIIYKYLKIFLLGVKNRLRLGMQSYD
tara:strand:- start:533 stop:1396 length:864 start_codon:yes stop_codon:yes gene_type:complete